MAKEKWTVFYNVENAGTPAPANYKEKTIKVKAGEKNNGLINSDTEPSTRSGTTLIGNVPHQCKVVTIEAEGAEEAAEALRVFYGQGLVNQGVMACKSSGLSEVKSQS